eukprot:GEMP01024003.1.p1 GENE.GEMP01024003.1~~GEMP01024003.1.p1  ORF type:complete len:460 (+),score=103.63 GEMP01024003.1:107-1381(+)
MILPYSTFDTWQCMCAFTILMCVLWLSWVLSNRTRRTTTRSPIPLISSWFNFGPTPRPLSGKYHVGMRSEVTADGDPLRLFYPIADNAQRTHKHDAPWLNINLAHYLKALGTMELKKGGDFSPPGPRASQIKITLAEILLGLIGYLAPANGLVLPATLDAEPLKNSEDFPLIVFSHGLLGTGAENGLMCVEWASHGFRVATVHHTDGSAPLAYRPDGTRVPFALCPQTNPDKIEFRRIQVKMRSQQLCRVVLHLCAQPNARADVALAGFSYGASTSFLAARELGCLATCAPIRVRCVLALDGWYFTGAAFPPDVFGDAGDVDMSKIPRRAYPAYFLTSEGFQNWSSNFKFAERLVNAGRETEEDKIDLLEILPGTRHGNFSEQMFWIPPWSGMKNFVLQGPCDAVETYYDIVDLGVAFLKKHAH